MLTWPSMLMSRHACTGLKLELLGLINPDKGSKAALITAIYRQPAFHGRALVDPLNGPTITADAVVG